MLQSFGIESSRQSKALVHIGTS